MWTVVFVTNDYVTAKEIKENLEGTSLKVRVKKRTLDDDNPGSFEILVPAAEVSLALAQVG
jgi:hypothetical protein